MQNNPSAFGNRSVWLDQLRNVPTALGVVLVRTWVVAK